MPRSARGKESRGKRSAPSVLAWRFGELALHPVFAHAVDRNDGVHRLLEHLGLRHEERLVEAD